ncbi:MAG TPA: GNAT family N-acetyltransferase [Solirubrobacteraceae bacterium]|nr:GNAT family N-acetyltransferase [Solirubrobacteraceae bacterium]
MAEGLVVRHGELYDVHYLNAVLLDAAPATPPQPDAVVALADRWLGGRGHRHLVFDDAAAGERIAGTLAAQGWERRRTVYMVRGAGADAIAPDPRAREISGPEMEALQLASLHEEVGAAAARSGLAARLAATQTALRAGTPARCFGAGDDGALQAMCTLFLDGDVDGRPVAMIEEVGTLVDHRGRGLARAVVGVAIAAARDWGADLTVVPADADDWPQLIYARLGFAPVGRQITLTRRLAAAPGSVSGAV